MQGRSASLGRALLARLTKKGVLAVNKFCFVRYKHGLCFVPMRKEVLKTTGSPTTAAIRLLGSDTALLPTATHAVFKPYNFRCKEGYLFQTLRTIGLLHTLKYTPPIY